MKFDGFQPETEDVVLYACHFYKSLGDGKMGSSNHIYFCDEYCETLRTYKEAIRKYVLHSASDCPSPDSESMTLDEYVEAAFTDIDSVVCPCFMYILYLFL